MNKKQLGKQFILFCVAVFLGIISCFVLSSKKSIYLSMVIIGISCIIIFLFINKFNFEKTILILFILFIPFMADIDFINREDFHIVSKVYYRFNYLHIFCIYFLYKIIQNIKNISIDIDLILIIIFNLICIISGYNAVNYKAFFFDYIRYVALCIAYIYFSRVFDFEKYRVIFYKYLMVGVILQLVLGILQKIKGSSLGLFMIGEGPNAFRVGVSGYEKGFSGTFSHPGPMALYANYVIILFLFNRNINKLTRVIGISISSLIVILTAGRTSIVIMILIYTCYFLNEILHFNIKSIFICTILLIVCGLFIALFYDRLLPVISRFTNSDIAYQYQNRIEHLLVGFDYLKENPLTGLGLNNYLDHTYFDYPISFYTNFYLSNPVHNAFLLYAVEIGVLGIIILCMFIFNNFVIYFKIRKDLSKREKNMLQGCLVIIVIWCIYGLQGWSGVQTRSLLVLLMACSIIHSNYKSIKENGIY